MSLLVALVLFTLALIVALPVTTHMLLFTSSAHTLGSSSSISIRKKRVNTLPFVTIAKVGVVGIGIGMEMGMGIGMGMGTGVEATELRDLSSKEVQPTSLRSFRFLQEEEGNEDLEESENCPQIDDLPNLAVLRNRCWDTSGSAEPSRYYNKKKDKECAVKEGHCSTKDANFGKLPDFRECQKTLRQVFKDVKANLDTVEEFECEASLEGAVERCDNTMQWLVDYYCPKKSFIEEHGAIFFPLMFAGLALVAFVGWTFRNMVSKDPLEDEEKAGIGKSAGFQYVAQPGDRSQYHGVCWDIHEAQWRAVVIKPDGTREELGLFDEEDAAAKAYDDRITKLHHQGEMTGPTNFTPFTPVTTQQQSPAQISPSRSPPSPPTPASPASPPSYMMENADPLANIDFGVGGDDDGDDIDTLKEQLISFYEFHDPERGDIPEHVDSLFAKYNFRQVGRAVKKKYGVLPPGWERKLERAEAKAVQE